MRNFTRSVQVVLSEVKQLLSLPAAAGLDAGRVLGNVERLLDATKGEHLSWVTFRERITRAALLLDETSATSKAGRLEVAKDLHALVDHGRLPDEISAEARHAEVMEELRRIRRDTALLNAHTVECTWEERDGRRTQPYKCAYHSTGWLHDLCPAHRAYLGYDKDERFTPPPWLQR